MGGGGHGWWQTLVSRYLLPRYNITTPCKALEGGEGYFCMQSMLASFRPSDTRGGENSSRVVYRRGGASFGNLSLIVADLGFFCNYFPLRILNLPAEWLELISGKSHSVFFLSWNSALLSCYSCLIILMKCYRTVVLSKSKGSRFPKYC